MVHSSIMARAHTAVVKAVLSGELANLKNSEVPCVDCGARASYYDHRDYTKPLTVEAVCRSCNCKRGTTPRIPDEIFVVQTKKYG